MRNSHNITLTNNDSLTEDEETTWSLPGAVAVSYTHLDVYKRQSLGAADL